MLLFDMKSIVCLGFFFLQFLNFPTGEFNFKVFLAFSVLESS